MRWSRRRSRLIYLRSLCLLKLIFQFQKLRLLIVDLDLQLRNPKFKQGNIFLWGGLPRGHCGAAGLHRTLNG